MTRIQQSLISAQEIGDEKLNIVQQLSELIEGKTRQLEQNFKILDYGKEDLLSEVMPIKDVRPLSPGLSPALLSSISANFIPPALSHSLVPSSAQGGLSTNSHSSAAHNSGNGSCERTVKRVRRGRADTNIGMDIDAETNIKIDLNIKPAVIAQSNNAQITQKKGANTNNSTNKKQKRKKAGRQSQQGSSRDTPPIEETEAIDPDEPTYCLCDQISFGEMILCDNDLCPIEWFHFSCVSLMSKPKGKWFCPNCRGDRPNTMKPKAQFLKELERYNREKEEKT